MNTGVRTRSHARETILRSKILLPEHSVTMLTNIRNAIRRLSNILWSSHVADERADLRSCFHRQKDRWPAEKKVNATKLMTANLLYFRPLSIHSYPHAPVSCDILNVTTRVTYITKFGNFDLERSSDVVSRIQTQRVHKFSLKREIRGATALTNLGRLSSRRWQSFPTAPGGIGLTCGQHIESHSCIFSFPNRTVTSLFK
jgi:hypothetical protein